jgi:hypothetical protein
MINIALKESWAGGEYFSRQFRQALAGSSFNITDVKHADAIIAHSLACYDLGEKSPATLYILIDPPYWPGKSFFGRVLSNKLAGGSAAKQNLGMKNHAKRMYWETAYILSKPAYISMAAKNNGALDFLSGLSQKSIYLIRNEKDKFCSADIQTALVAYPNVTFVPLPGEHDDYYTNPGPYINLLAHYFTSIGKV